MNGLLLFKAIVLGFAIILTGAWYDIKKEDGSRYPLLLCFSAELWAIFYYFLNY